VGKIFSGTICYSDREFEPIEKYDDLECDQWGFTDHNWGDGVLPLEK
jgi:hypothetical protein